MQDDGWNELLSLNLWQGMTPSQVADCICYISGAPTFRDQLRWADDGGEWRDIPVVET